MDSIIESFTSSDGYTWKYRHYPSTDDAQSLNVVCVHGIQSHGGWYHGSCQFLAESGFPVYFLDRRGSGMNEKDRGDTPSFRRLLDDIAEWIHALFLRKPDAKVVLFGISWGGKLVTAFQRRHPGLTRALALICPGFFAKVRPSFLTRMRILGSRLVRPRRLFPIPLNEPELFTETPRWLQFLREDKHGLQEATARFLIESVRLDMYLKWVPKYVQVPTLLLLAGQDRIIQNEPTQQYVQKFVTEQCTIHDYPEAHHTLEFEEDPTPIFSDIRDWLLTIHRRP